MKITNITVERLTHIYGKGTPQAHAALKDISFQVPSGSCTGIVGVTGSGKSTLVQHFNGILRPTTGSVTIGAMRLTAQRTSARELRELRREVGLLFQLPEAQLFARTIFDDIAFGPRQAAMHEEAVAGRVKWAAEAVALPVDNAFLARSPFDLSGGQLRRVALAGVLAVRPQVLILDEPSAGLDAQARDELFETLAGLRKRQGTTLILVSHDMGEIASLADQIVVLAEGTLVAAGAPQDVFAKTSQVEAAGLLPPPLAETRSLAEEAGVWGPTVAQAFADVGRSRFALGSQHTEGV